MFDRRKRKAAEDNPIASLSPEHSSPRTKELSSSHGVMPSPRKLTNAEKRARGCELANANLKTENEKGKSAKEVNVMLALEIASRSLVTLTPLGG